VSERVSVLIATYNYARYLPQCLGRVLNQTRPPDEIIVVDDGSTDGTPELMKQFPEVRYVYQQNAGKAAAFGRALSLSSGEIVCHLDADDYWELGKLACVLRCLGADSGIGGVVHEVSYVDAYGRALHFPWEQQHPAESLLLTLDECEDTSFLYRLPKARGRSWGVPNTCCVRRGCVEDLFPLPPEVGGAVDGAMLAGALRFGVAYLPDALAAYRIHGDNAGFGNVASNQETMHMWEFLLGSPNFRRFLSRRHAHLLRAKILERKAYVASRTGRKVLDGAWAGLLVPFILAANGRCCNWRHLALPVACLLPIKRSNKRMPAKIAPVLQPANSSSATPVRR
jgi:glycosyltransferase involved in cell wall biosynthesis